MIKHPQSELFARCDCSCSSSSDRLFIWSTCWDMGSEEEEEGADDAREKRFCPLIASVCVIVCVSCMNGTCSRVRIAHHDTALIQNRSCWQLLCFFFYRNSKTNRPLFVFSLFVELDPSLPQSFSFLFCIAGKTSTTAPFFSLAITVFSRFAVDNGAGQCHQC